MRLHPAIGLLVFGVTSLGAVGLPAPGHARTVKLPEAKPLVAFEVPDDWILTPAADGLELSAPDHSSVIEVGVVKRAKGDIVAWQKAATQRMKAFGVSFDPKINPQHDVDGQSAAVAGIGHIFDRPKDGPDLAVENLPSWSMAPPLSPAGTPAAARPATADGKPADAKSAAAKPTEQKPADSKPVEAKSAEAKSAESKSAEAKPAEAKPAETQAAEAKSAEFKPVETKTTGTPAKRPHFRSLVLYGGVLDGKPVDVQFLDFSATGPTSFVMQQQSSATDERAGAVINSVRFLK